MYTAWGVSDKKKIFTLNFANDWKHTHRVQLWDSRWCMISLLLFMLIWGGGRRRRPDSHDSVTHGKRFIREMSQLDYSLNKRYYHHPEKSEFSSHVNLHELFWVGVVQTLVTCLFLPPEVPKSDILITRISSLSPERWCIRSPIIHEILSAPSIFFWLLEPRVAHPSFRSVCFMPGADYGS